MARSWSASAVTPDEVVSKIKSGDRVFVHGAAATPTTLLDAMCARSDLQGVTLYTVTDPFDLTGFTFEAAIGATGGTPVCSPVVTHNTTGGEITLTISQATSEATPSGRYSWELVDTTSGVKRPILNGTVHVREGVLPR